MGDRGRVEKRRGFPGAESFGIPTIDDEMSAAAGRGCVAQANVLSVCTHKNCYDCGTSHRMQYVQRNRAGENNFRFGSYAW
jgi:hypothetical protein